MLSLLRIKSMTHVMSNWQKTEKDSSKERKVTRSSRRFFLFVSELDHLHVITQPLVQSRALRCCSHSNSSLVITSHPGNGSSPAFRGCMGQIAACPIALPHVHRFLTLSFSFSCRFRFRFLLALEHCKHSLIAAENA